MARLEEHDERCRRIANELEAIVDGEIAKCEHCKEEFEYEEDGEEPCICPYCGEEIEDVNLVSVRDWLDGVLDIDVLCSLSRGYKAAKICVACGGPNVYVDTWEQEVRLYWGGDEGRWYFTSSVATELDEAVSELFSLHR